ncbi:hypothetical protein GCM10028862_02980 [Luteimonas pelagia]
MAPLNSIVRLMGTYMAQIIRAFLFAAALMLPGLAFATAQSPDVILIHGEEHALNTNPLATELKRLNWDPPEDIVISSANWRGYIASWEVKDEQLRLTDVTIRLHGADRGDYIKKSILGELYPSASNGVIADWYSGALIVPQGEITGYVHMGYGSSYESYQVLRIESGRVVEHVILSDDEFVQYKDKKFNEFSATEEFKVQFEELRNDADGMTEEEVLDFMKSFFAERYLSL